MNRTWRRISRAGLVVALAAASCGRAATRTSPADRNRLSTEELRAAGYADAFTSVQSLRPQWLRQRGALSINLRETVKVYLDGSLLGGPESLRQITTRSISTIQYLDALEATQRWGLDHGQGAIVVSTRRS